MKTYKDTIAYWLPDPKSPGHHKGIVHQDITMNIYPKGRVVVVLGERPEKSRDPKVISGGTNMFPEEYEGELVMRRMGWFKFEEKGIYVFDVDTSLECCPVIRI